MGGSSRRAVKRVLLVDDVEMELKAWVRECRRNGKVPLPARNKHEALDLARREKPEMAVVDLLMPHDSGLAVIHELKTLGIDVFTILVSGTMCVDYAMMGVDAGADDCYDKEVTITQMVHRVEHGRRPDPEFIKVPTLADVERNHLARVLNDCGGNVTHAADVLGEHRYTLQRKIAKLMNGALRPKQRRRRVLRRVTPRRLMTRQPRPNSRS
jgi:two-component system, response regulator RegA